MINHKIVPGGPASLDTADPGQQWLWRELGLWAAYASGVDLDLSRPGKPSDKASIGAFNSQFCLECLNQHWFLSLEVAETRNGVWRQVYDHVRQYGVLGHFLPLARAGTAVQPV